VGHVLLATLKLGISVAVGFVVVFVLAGSLVAAGGGYLLRAFPLVALLIGAGLAVLDEASPILVRVATHSALGPIRLDLIEAELRPGGTP